MFLLRCSILSLSTAFLIEPPRWPEIWSGQALWTSPDNTSELNNYGNWYYNISENADPSTYLLRQDNYIKCSKRTQMNDGNGCSNIWHGVTVYAYSWSMDKCCIIYHDFPPTQPLWLVDNNATMIGYKILYIGAMNIGNINVSIWSFGDNQLYDETQLYYANAQTGLPVALHINPENAMLVWYNISLDIQAFNQTVFVIPNIDQCVNEKDEICLYN